MTTCSARSILLASVVASAGCAARETTRPATVEVRAPREDAPSATVRVLDHLGWPYRISKVLVVLDGTVAMKSESYARGQAAPPVITLATELAGGEHTLQMLVEAQVSLTAAGPECAVTLKTTTRFAAEAGAPAEITADLYQRGAELRFQDRVDLRMHVRGPRQEGWVAQPLPLSERARCFGMEAADEAICRVEGNVADGTRQRDVIRVLCNRDKLDQMRVLARMRDEAHTRADAAVPARRLPLEIVPDDERPARDAAPTGAHRWAEELEQRERVKVLEQRIVALGREAEQCVGEVPVYFPGATVTADEACFARAAPEVE